MLDIRRSPNPLTCLPRSSGFRAEPERARGFTRHASDTLLDGHAKKSRGHVIASSRDVIGDVPDCSRSLWPRDPVLAKKVDWRGLRFANEVIGARKDHGDCPRAAIAARPLHLLYSR